MDEQAQSMNQKKIAFAQGVDVKVLVDILKDCRLQLHTIIAEDQWHTMLNALTLEIEAQLVSRLVIYLQDIKEGKLHEQG